MTNRPTLRSLHHPCLNNFTGPTMLSKRILLLCIRSFGVLVLGSAGWTIVASLVFLTGSGLIRSFSYPLYQWWLYLLFSPPNRIVALWLGIGAAAATAIMAVFVAALLVGRPKARSALPWRSQQRAVPAPVRGKSDNHGHADWLSIQKAQALFPGPAPGYGGIVVGEAYRVDEDAVAELPFDPGVKATWGKGGKAPLLIDPCRSGPTHSLIFAGAGSFKSTSAISTLLTWSGSAVVLDPSCELGPMLANALQNMGHRIYQLGLHEGIGFNVLDWIDIGSPLAATNVLSIVDWVCGDAAPGQDANGAFFASRGKALVSCLLAHMLWDPALPKEDKTLAQLRIGLSTPEPELRKILQSIHERSLSPLARDYAGTLKGLVDETFSGIYANADDTTAWLANPAFASLVSGNTFKSLDLLDGKTSVFLQIPLAALQSTPAIGRTVVGALLNAAYEADGRISGRILYLLDEVARLGPMKIIETARDAGRKYGITLQLLYQSVGQLEKQWGKDGKRAWYDGVSHRTYAAVQDLDTAKELEETFGNYAVEAISGGSNKGTSGKAFELGSMSRGTSTSSQEISRPLIRRDELMNDCRTDEAFIIVRGAKPLRCGRAIYFRRPEMVARVEANRFSRATLPALP
jgi:type IV secretion system protein VirD4